MLPSNNYLQSLTSSEPSVSSDDSLPFFDAHPSENSERSLTNVSFEHVKDALDVLYPPDDVASRNAASRTDGYWAYIRDGEEPPLDLTYGEFDFSFFAQLLDKANFHYNRGHRTEEGWEGKVFADIGSGTGRLVLGAAALHPQWKICKGVELLEGIHNIALSKLEECSTTSPSKFSLSVPTEQHKNIELRMSPIKFTCGSFDDSQNPLGNIDLGFAFSSCFTPELMLNLSKAIGRQCKPGTIIITTDYMLHLEGSNFQLELVESMDGYNEITGGYSTAYIHRVLKSDA